MAYWIHENGETIGPLKAVEVLERAQPRTLVSNGQEWVRFDEHPAFPSCSSEEPKAARVREVRPTMDEIDKGEFWIWEHGQAYGPLNANGVLARANGKTLVSLGQEWKSIAEHPVFCKFASALLEVNDQSPNGDENSWGKLDAYEGDEWVSVAESEGYSTAIGRRPQSGEDRYGKPRSEPNPGVGLFQALKAIIAGTSTVVRLSAILGVLLLTLIIFGTHSYINRGVETEEKGALGKAIRKADANWNAGRHKEAVSGYQNLIGDHKTQYKPDDANRMLTRVLQFYIVSSDEKKIAEFVTVGINSGIDLQFSNPKIQQTYDYYREKIESSMEMERRRAEEAEAQRRKAEAQKEAQRSAVFSDYSGEWAYGEYSFAGGAIRFRNTGGGAWKEGMGIRINSYYLLSLSKLRFRSRNGDYESFGYSLPWRSPDGGEICEIQLWDTIVVDDPRNNWGYHLPKTVTPSKVELRVNVDGVEYFVPFRRNSALLDN